MTRVDRTRSRLRSAYAGSRTGTFGGVDRTEVQFVPNAYYEVCNDSHGRPVIASPLTIDKTDLRDFKGYTATRTNPLNLLEHVEWKDYWYAYQVGLSISHLDTTVPNASQLAVTVRARTNPSRPGVTPLTIVQDLYELPKMLKDVGKLLRTPRSLLSPREQANHFLGAKFGWLPLINDARQLLESQKYIHKRVGELNRLYSSGGLRRRVRLGDEHKHSSATSVLESELLLVTGKISTDTSQKAWGTVRWIPNGPAKFHNPSDTERLNQASRLVGGLTPEGLAKGAWDLLPWSWMVDWFGNAGDWITQNSFSVPATSPSVCVMRERNTVVQHSLITAPYGFSDLGGVGIRSTKSRVISSGALAGSIPTLDLNRLSVLGALFVQRFKR